MHKFDPVTPHARIRAQARQTVAPFHRHRLRIKATLDRWPTIGRHEPKAPMRSMNVVMTDEDRQGSLKMLGAHNQQPV
jgi:hypothetical protein